MARRAEKAAGQRRPPGLIHGYKPGTVLPSACRALPTASRILVEHLDDYDNLLPHVFLAELTRHLLRGPADVTPIVQSLEDSFASGDPAIAELISVSCIENIASRDDLTRLLTGVTGNSIQTEWTQQNS